MNGTRVEDQAHAPKLARVRKARAKAGAVIAPPAAGRLPGPNARQVWTAGAWRWDRDAAGVRYRRLLTDAEKVARELAKVSAKERRELVDRALLAIAGPLVTVEGDGAKLKRSAISVERPESRGRVVAEIPRAKGGHVVVQGRTWLEPSTGELRPYVGVHVRFEQFGVTFRTRGSCFLAEELGPVIEALTREKARIDAGDYDRPHFPVAAPAPVDSTPADSE